MGKTILDYCAKPHHNGEPLDLVLGGMKSFKLGKGMKVLRTTKSLCPECVDDSLFDQMKIDAIIYAKDGRVWIAKECRKHGLTEELYYGDYDMYKKAERFDNPGIEIQNPQITDSRIDCPRNCGLCNMHRTHTALANIVLTNRCDLTCWYCFFFAKQNDPIYEPTLEQFRGMFRVLREEQPVPCNALQFTGGEPTLREDLVDIARIARDMGYEHIQLNTNGVKLSKKPELVKELKDAGVNVVYLSFDGVSPETNPKNYWEAPKAIENLRAAKLGVVLVPTVIKGVNDHELGDILRFGFGNNDVIRGINFQPVSLVGRMPKKLREKQRITIPDAIRRIEEQTDGQVGREDFYTIPCVAPISDFISEMKGEPKYKFTNHFACGMATYIFRDGDRLVPITRFVDVDAFFEYVKELTQEIRNSRFKPYKKAAVSLKLLKNLGRFIDDEKKPKGLKLRNAITGAFTGANYDGLRMLHYESLFVGMMHFMDPYNYDVDRVEKCSIHYATPDGRVIPFCAFNVIPELYRDKIQREFGISAGEWEKRNGRKVTDDLYKRQVSEKERAATEKFYSQFRNND